MSARMTICRLVDRLVCQFIGWTVDFLLVISLFLDFR